MPEHAPHYYFTLILLFQFAAFPTQSPGFWVWECSSGKVRFLVCGKRKYNKFIVASPPAHTQQTIFMYGYCRCRELSLMHSYSIGSSCPPHRRPPVSATEFAPLLAAHAIMSPRRAEMPALALGSPLLCFYSDSYMLVRYFYRSCGGPLATPPARAAHSSDVEWSLVCLFVCFAVRPQPTLFRPLPHGPRWRTSHEESPTEHTSNHPFIHIRSTTSSFFPICTSISFPTAFCQTF